RIEPTIPEHNLLHQTVQNLVRSGGLEPDSLPRASQPRPSSGLASRLGGCDSAPARLHSALDSSVSATDAEINTFGETRCQRKTVQLTPSCTCASNCGCRQVSCLPRAEKPPL